MTTLSQVETELPLRYPLVPGSKKEGTSYDARPTRQEARSLRFKALEVLSGGNYTADEIASRLGKSVLSIRPRCSELIALGKIRETTERRLNQSGRWAAVLEVLR